MEWNFVNSQKEALLQRFRFCQRIHGFSPPSWYRAIGDINIRVMWRHFYACVNQAPPNIARRTWLTSNEHRRVTGVAGHKEWYNCTRHMSSRLRNTVISSLLPPFSAGYPKWRFVRLRHIFPRGFIRDRPDFMGAKFKSSCPHWPRK